MPKVPPKPGTQTIADAYAKSADEQKRLREAAISAVTAVVEGLGPDDLEQFRADILAVLDRKSDEDAA